MRDVEVRPDVDLEELLDNEVPCGGIATIPIARKCDASAVLMAHAHGCRPSGRPGLFKCINCWQDWYKFHSAILARGAQIRCLHCHQRFSSVESFSDYRPF